MLQAASGEATAAEKHGLRQIESQCCLSNMLSLRDRDEDTELIQSHG
jgi:hypothetical protein